MSMLPGMARSGVSAMAGLRSCAPVTSSMFSRSLTPLALKKSNQQISSAAMATQFMIRPFTQSSKPVNAPATTSLSQSESLKLLNTQRSVRPNSPHLTIYQPQVTWYLSIFTRMTGVGLSVLFYGWAITYFALPYATTGQAFTSAHLVQYAALAPFWLKMAIKVPVAFGLSFHTFNGIRHLAWDIGYGLSMKGVYTGAYIVLGASVAATAYLCSL